MNVPNGSVLIEKVKKPLFNSECLILVFHAKMFRSQPSRNFVYLLGYVHVFVQLLFELCHCLFKVHLKMPGT